MLLLARLALPLILCLALPAELLANRAEQTLHDAVYVSPAWGYAVRWYGDEWSVADTSSGAGDTLQLRDALGSRVTFTGRADYGGDARVCLDDQLQALVATGARDVTVLQDEAGRPQKIYHPWRSWIFLLAGIMENGQDADQVVYLDCRTLVPEQAVLVRELRTPAATYADDLWQFDVLNVALPRGAWAGNSYTGLTAPGLDDYGAISPLPADSSWPWVYPDDPKLIDTGSEELGMMTQVDGDAARGEFVVTVQNRGAAPLVIDPARFTLSNDPQMAQSDADLNLASATWDDGAPAGERTLATGAWASLTLHFPPSSPPRTPRFLVYWDSALSEGFIRLDCIDNCGYGGGGSRPMVRVGR